MLGHLIYGEQADWIPRLKIILFEGNKIFETFNRYTQFELLIRKTINNLLVEFAELRAQKHILFKLLKLSEEQEFILN